MKIGDRVRLLRGTEEGTIVKFVDDKYLEIEIEDGFVLPALIKEVVPISPEEGFRFQDRPPELPSQSPVIPDQNIDSETERLLLAIELKDESQVEIYLVNVTNYRTLFSIGQAQMHNKNISGLFSGICESKSYVPLGKMSANELAKIPKIIIQIVFHSIESRKKRPPLDLEKSWDWKKITSRKEMTPFINRPAFQVPIEQDIPDINPNLLKEKMMENIGGTSVSRIKDEGQAREKVVDLHIDQLVPNPGALTSAEMLAYQINTFEKEMDKALVNDLKSIKFIHGIGNGTLRNKIHKLLSKNATIKYYEDADKERFGYGATLIYFK